MHKLKQAVTVYKKASSGRIVVMRLPKGTRVNRAITSNMKNRADFAQVLAVTSLDGKAFFRSARPYMGSHRDGTVYRVGQDVTPRYAFDTSNAECGSGIHFFRALKSAQAYG